MAANEPAPRPKSPYLRYLRATFSLSLIMMLRRKRVVLAAGLVLSPVLIPLALAFLSVNAFAEDGNRVFVHLMEYLYLSALTPLLALFFGCMLIGEDVESETLPYLLTRPLPRTAIVIGRFGAYVIVATALLMVSILMMFAACTSLGNLAFTAQTIPLLLHYEATAFMAVLAYGALSMFLGAMTKHPVVIGILLIFGWQRLALYIPGAVDFLTIEKYITSLFPKLATQRENIVIQTALAEFEKQQLLVDTTQAALILIAITLAFVAGTAWIVRHREYSATRTLGA